MNNYSWCSSPNNKLAASPEIEREGESSNSDSPEESSSWTEILDGYSDYVRRIEAADEQAGYADHMKPLGDDHKHKHKKIINYDNCVNNGGDINNDNDDDGGSDSMVSDAGSGPKWRHQQLMMMNHGYRGTPNYNIPRKLNFKSKRSANNCKEVPYDESLEDTASSPVNSPKLTMGLKRMDLNTRRTGTDQESNFDTRLIKGNSGHDDDLADHQEYRLHADRDEKITEATKKNINFDVVQNFNNELQKRGMCIVPVSMLPAINHINYHIG